MDNTPQNAVIVRKGAPEDGELLCHLISALADYEKLPRPTPEAAQRLVRDAYGPDPRFDTWFGEYRGVAVGYAISFYTYSTFLALPTFYLEDLFILPEYRAMKVGKSLFLHCARAAYEQGCGRMEWQVLHWNEPALRFYDHLGGKPMAEWLPYRATRDELVSMLNVA
ncbi:MAG: GNAT family N-acetyltransferase [Chloroflexi bacterium]|nr:GNAT family N-acetyltransferase [Chloroflexota bacterium]MCL5273698.1 GNAT family N-acetyltransferase [Chloroflexota bacterium]